MWPSVSANEWQHHYEEFLNATTCTNSTDSLTWLRKVDADVPSDAFQSDFTTLNHINPVVDGDFIQDLGSKELNAGHFVKVPSLLGTTQDEVTWNYYGVEKINATGQFLEMASYDGLSHPLLR